MIGPNIAKIIGNTGIIRWGSHSGTLSERKGISEETILECGIKHIKKPKPAAHWLFGVDVPVDVTDVGNGHMIVYITCLQWIA